MQPEHPDNVPSRVFRLCEACGRPTPAQLPDCVNCGARSLQAFVANDQARAEQRFARAYFSRATPLTYAILVANLLIYVVMTIVAGGNLIQNLVFGVDPATLIAFGAKTNELLGQRGEWFRLVTPIFIHGGLIHIFSNSYALWIVGPQVERLYGSTRFALIYLLCGVGGVGGSYIGSMLLHRNPTVPSVGASGAIFGLFGVLAVFGYKYRHELPPTFRKAVGSSVFPVIAINLIIGFSIPVIDNGAHIGGLLCGAILAIAIPYVAPDKERVSSVGLALVGLCIVIVAYCFVLAWKQSSQYLARRPVVLDQFLESINEANRLLGNSPPARAEGGPPPESSAEFDRVADRLEALRAPDKKSEEISHEFARILRAQKAALDETSRATRDAKLQANAERFVLASRELRKWIASEGAKIGIVETPGPGKSP